MEETVVSKKRKTSPPLWSSQHRPFMGVSSRCKSQIYLDCTRSRIDSFRLNKNQPSLRSSPVKFLEPNTRKDPRLNAADIVGHWSCSSVKDLRTRRVFSLAGNSCRLCDDDVEEEKRSNGLDRKSNFEDDILNYECLQATPPDSEIFRGDFDVDFASVKLSTENPAKIEALQDNNVCEKIGNFSVTKSGQKKSSRVRVFKTPGSLSYRRLLPYLMDLAQDDSCSATKGYVPNTERPQKMKDALASADALSDGNGANSPMLSDSLKDNSERVDSPALLVDQCCLKATADDASEKIKMMLSCQDLASLKPESSSLPDNHETSLLSDDARAFDGVENNVSVITSTCNVQRTSEDSVHWTTPDVNNPAKAVAYQNVDNRTKFTSHDVDQVPAKPLNECTLGNNSYLGDIRMDSSSKAKCGLNQCSQLKLFKTKRSFNYRRMLPFLMDIAKDNSGDSGNGNCPKIEKSLQENMVSPPSSTSSPDDSASDKLNDRIPLMEDNTDSSTPQISLLPAENHPSTGNQMNGICSDLNTDASLLVGSQVLGSLSDKVRQSQSDTALTTGNLIDGSSSGTMPACSSLDSSPTISEDCLAVVSQEFSVKNEENNSTPALQLTNAAKLVEVGNLSLDSYKVEASDTWGNPANGLTKSILRRHPRGCRGHCTCLNCASFRLHAERAFEFSKNQLEDAEEIALDLIKELSHVRCMLERAASGSTCNLSISKNEVQEACQKASEAEELAKSRLRQMIYDLNIHCRISGGERPRVRFSSNVEEKLFH